MNTILILGLTAVAAVIGLAYLFQWAEQHVVPMVLPVLGVGAAVVVALWVVVQVLSEVFSLHGLLYSVGVVGVRWHAHRLNWPSTVFVITWLGLMELGVAVAWALNRRYDRGPEHFGGAWLYAHASAPVQLVTALTWYCLVAPTTLACNAWHRRGWAWPTRPERAGEVFAMIGDRINDVGYGLRGMLSAVRAPDWRRYINVVRTTPVPADEHDGHTVIDGTVIAEGEPLRTWKIRGDLEVRDAA